MNKMSVSTLQIQLIHFFKIYNISILTGKIYINIKTIENQIIWNILSTIHRDKYKKMIINNYSEVRLIKIDKFIAQYL